MADTHAPIPLNDATSQLDRWQPALESGYAPVDGRSFETLLDFGIRYARLIEFYDLSDQPDGRWVEFFLSDPAMILAAVHATDIAGLRMRFEDRIAAVRRARTAEEKLDALSAVFGLLATVAWMVDLWLAAAAAHRGTTSGAALYRALAAAVERDLAAPMGRAKGFALASAETLGRRVVFDVDDLSSAWRLGGIGPDNGPYLGETAADQIDAVLGPLTKAIEQFLSVLEMLRDLAGQWLPEALKSQDHAPQIALYIAFARIFKTAQDTINTFSDRLARFYYRDVLRGQPRGGVPDTAYLTFALEPDAPGARSFLPEDTLFDAGADAQGATLVYGSNRAITVTAAALDQVRAVEARTGTLIAGANEAGPDVIRSLWATEIDPTAAPDTGWATFGGAAPDPGPPARTVPAAVGFALASPVLLMAGGSRSIAVTLHFETDYFAGLTDRLAKVAQFIETDVATVAKTLFTDAFVFSLSTVEGWFDLPPPDVDSDGIALTMTLTAGATDPAFAAFDPEEPTPEDGPNPDPTLPTLRAMLKTATIPFQGPEHSVSIPALALLDAMTVSEVALRVTVENLLPERVANTDGAVDPATPFAVFGLTPVPGAYLDVGATEIFEKVPDSLGLTLNWFDLPADARGFTGYYQDYLYGPDGKRRPPNHPLFTNAVFKGRFSTVDQGAEPLDDVKRTLFRTKDLDEGGLCANAAQIPTGPLCDASHFALIPPGTDCSKDWVLPRLPDEASIRLTMAEPSYGFGAPIYPQNVLNAIVKMLPDTEGCQSECIGLCSTWQGAREALQAIVDTARESGDPADPEELWPLVFPQLVAMAGVYEGLVKACQDRGRSKSGDTQGTRRLPPLIAEDLTSDPETLSAYSLEYLRYTNNFVRNAIAGRANVSAFDPCFVDYFDYLLPAAEILVCFVACLIESDPGTERELPLFDTGPEGEGSILDCLQAAIDAMPPEDACLTQCMDGCMKVETPLEYPNDPYLPQVVGAAVDYSAVAAVPPGSAPNPLSLFLLLPFDGSSPIGDGAVAEIGLLPVDEVKRSLYLGFAGFFGPQDLTLLVQMAPRPADSGAPPATAPVWSYLKGDRWIDLAPDATLSDGTHGLQATGILRLRLPAIPDRGSSILPDGSAWLRARPGAPDDRFPDTVAITAQAVAVSWRDGIDPDATGRHLAEPLPAGSITKGVEALPGIATVTQPMPSFGGAPPEDTKRFQTRMGERLRHKDRAVQSWDYERLVLERFPVIWKVKALPLGGVGAQARPGDVLVMVVPGPEIGEVEDPTVPGAPSDLLDEIAAYLEDRAPAFATISVVNPYYIRLQVTTEVLFSASASAGGLTERLDQDLRDWLSPWFYDLRRAASQGRYVELDEISAFVQTRPYVDAVISLSARPLDPQAQLALRRGAAPAPPGWCFYTSAEKHLITEPPADAWAREEL